MPRRLLLPLLAAALLASGCDLLFPSPSPLRTALNRCDLGAEPAPAYRQASLDLIAAAEAGTLPVASDRWFVGYADDGLRPASPGAVVARAAAVRSAHGLAHARTVAPGLDLVTMGARDADAAATARRLIDDPRVRYVHPDVALRPSYLPNDPRFDEQWTLASFGLPEAWAIERGSSRVTVAILDTAFDLDHPDLAPRFDPGYDFFNDDASPDVGATGVAHGTHVAGIVGAVGNDGVGVAGVAPEAVRLLPVQVFDDTGGVGSVDAVVTALHWVAGRPVAGPAPRPAPVEIVNLSLGTDGAYQLVPALEDAIRDARRAGVLVLAASGNNAFDGGVIAPANGPCAVAVGSVDEDLGLSWFSNFVAGERAIDLAGPGGRSLPDAGEPGLPRAGVTSTVPYGAYGQLQGTSMSTPWVAGVAALLASREPGWTSEDLLRALLDGAWLPAGASPYQQGFGIPCPDALLGAATTCGR
jgi:serine protease